MQNDNDCNWNTEQPKGDNQVKSFDMIKQAGSMRKQMKKMQKEMAKQTSEGVSGGVTAVARGDMSLSEVRIDPSAVDASKTELLEKQVVSAVNNALRAVQQQAAAEMAKSAGGLGGLAGLMGQ